MKKKIKNPSKLSEFHLSSPSKLMVALLGVFLVSLSGCGAKDDVTPEAQPPASAAGSAPPESGPVQTAPRSLASKTSVFQSNDNTVNKIAAVVNGEMISLFELRGRTMADLGRRRIPPNDPRSLEVQNEVLNSLVNDILMRQEAKRFKVTVSDAEVEAEIQRQMERAGMTPAQFDAQLQREGLTKTLYKERMSNNLLRQRMAGYMVSRKVFVTPEEVSEYYANHKEKFVRERTVDFSLMIIPERLDVMGIYTRLRNGQIKFEDVAREHSVHPSKREGGSVKNAVWDRLPPDLQRILNSLRDGQYAQPGRTPDGILIFRRDAIQEAKQLTFEEARPKVEETLLAPLLEERFKEWTNQLRSKAVIDIRI